MRAYGATDVGRERAVNQDYIFTSTKKIGCLDNLFIVADGMGGHKAGDIASRFTVEHFVDYVSKSDEKDQIAVINNAISEINSEIVKMAEGSKDYTGMGTTLVVATIDNDKLKVANVGDSRLYIIGKDISQITRDHSLVEEMIMAGEINRSEARTHQRKNVITRAIGGYDHVEAEMFLVDLNKGDKILICSDGLTNMIEDREIFSIVKKNDNIKDAVDELISTANSYGGRDNISVIIIES